MVRQGDVIFDQIPGQHKKNGHGGDGPEEEADGERGHQRLPRIGVGARGPGKQETAGKADLADAHVLALKALETEGRLILNLGNGQGFSVREVIESARRVTGHAIPAEVHPRRPGDPAVLVASSDKAIHTLGWKPKYTQLDEIIRTAWIWHQKRYAE